MRWSITGTIFLKRQIDMSCDDMVTLRLSRNDVGQIIDGLCARLDSWRTTQRYFEGDHVEAGTIIEDCDGAEEAKKIADCYNEIIDNINRQMKT
jgi:hypothetical protein